MPPAPVPETHLGDGLYASHDGWHIVLRAPRASGDHVVALEPDVLVKLMAYVNGLQAGAP